MKRYIITALCAFIVCRAWGQLTYTTRVAPITQLSYSVIGDSCVELNFPNAEKSDVPEQPEVPIFYYTFILPTNCKVTSVEALGSTTSTHTFPLPLKCTPPAMTTNGDIVYSQNNDTPQYLTELLYVVSDSYFDGDIHLVTIAYSPIMYTKGSRTLFFVRVPQFVVRYQNGTPDGITPITPRNRNYAERVAMIEQMVDNPQNVAVWIPETPTVSTDSVLLGSSTYLPGMGYEYLVITTRDLYETTQKLIDWKRSKGIHAGVVCYEDIRDMDITDTQTQYEEINDAAGHLRKYLRNAHANGLQYVFLVGERGEIPYRKYYYYSYIESRDTPTDLYYAELGNQWGKYFENYNSYQFNGSLGPDIAVGRLFVSNNEEWQSYINRLITYERNPGCGNPHYLMNAFFIQSDGMQKPYSQALFIADSIKGCYNNTTIWNEEPDYDAMPVGDFFPKGKDVIDELQKGQYGYFSTFAHGGQMSINTFSGGDNSKDCHVWTIRSVENDTITDAWRLLTNNGSTSLEPGAGIDRLNIPQNPFIVYSMSCTTMPYDTVLNYVKSPDTRSYNPVTVGVAFTAKSNSAVAYLGNTRVGLYVSGYPNNYSTKLQKIFNDCIINMNNHIGIAENYSKLKHKDAYISATHNLLGCPEIPMWTAIPQKITNIADTDTVSVTPLFDNSTPQTMLYGDVASNTIYNQNHSIAKIKQNYYPFYLPIKLQNLTLQSKHTIFGGDVVIGRNVKPDVAQGDFVIDSKGSLAIETTGNVILSSGTTIKSGGMLIIKPIKQ